MFDWTRFLGFGGKRPTVDVQEAPSSTVRLLAITADDLFYSGLVDLGASCGWEIRRASTIQVGIEVLRSLSMPLVILDWGQSGDDDWRDGVRRLSAEPNHPCVLLASRVVDENLRQEVLRYHGYDVVPRTADPDQIARAIKFAWFWTTRSPSFTEPAKQKEGRQ